LLQPLHADKDEKTLLFIRGQIQDYTYAEESTPSKDKAACDCSFLVPVVDPTPDPTSNRHDNVPVPTKHPVKAPAANPEFIVDPQETSGLWITLITISSVVVLLV
jgi:hypothetical protein